MSAVAESFGFDAMQKDRYLGGGLATALFLIGAPAAMLVGVAADGCARRVDLLVIVLVIGAIGCTGSGASTSYSQLYASRALTGVSLGGALPLVFSLLGDLAPPSRRTALSGRVGLAMAMGSMGGQSLAGFLGPSYGWRAPFGIIALTMMVLAVRVRTTMLEPPRQAIVARGASGGDGAAKAQRGRLRVFTVPSVLLIFAQGIPGCVPHGVIGAFLPDFLHADVGFAVETATWIMNGYAAGGLCGVLVGGELGQRLYNKSVVLPQVLMLCAGTLGILPMWALIAHTPSSALGCALLAALGGFLATQTGPNVRAVLTNTTRPDERGLAFASFALCDDLGKGAGPALLAHAVRLYGRRATFAWAMLGWAPCALLNGATALTVRRDEAAAFAGSLASTAAKKAEV